LTNIPKVWYNKTERKKKEIKTMMNYWRNDFDKAFDEALADLEREQNAEAEGNPDASK
jgi:hypothetical protein